MSSSAVVLNPAKLFDVLGHRERIANALAAEGWPPPQWFFTTPGDPGAGQTAQAVAQGAEVVFASGGDGTVRACASVLAGTDVPLAVLPTGTTNLLARNLGLPDDLVGGVRAAVRGGRRRIDVGVVDNSSCFLVAAGMGFDAELLSGAPEYVKRLLGWVAYVVSGVRHLRDPRFEVTIELDGAEPVRRRVRTVLVANVGQLPGGIALLPDAVPDDGWLDVAVLSPRLLVDWFGLLRNIMFRSGADIRLRRYRARSVEVTALRPQARQVDGDALAGGTTLSVQVRSKALTVCVPSDAAPARHGAVPARLHGPLRQFGRVGRSAARA